MKRFYKEVSVGEGNTILLDGKPIKTKARAILALPTRVLAEAVAEEWRAQGETIQMQSMPLYKLSCDAIDGFASGSVWAVEEILAYANDLLCYRAAAPAELVARQSAAWDPLLAWAAERYARLNTGTGIAHIKQSEETLSAYRRALEAEDAFTLTALLSAVKICGSLVLALALREGRLAAGEAFALSRLDETFQAEKWGADTETESRARALLAELVAAERFLALARER
jgi:chaperone required for assembly of F1-ATPase